MFDGSYRSRREINLSGGRRRAISSRSNTSGKRSTLQIAKEQRELRRIQALQNNSATYIQRYVRGRSGRRRLGLDLAERQDLGICTMQENMSILAMRLSLYLLPFWPTVNGAAKSDNLEGERSSNSWVGGNRKVKGTDAALFKYDKTRTVLQKLAREYEEQSVTLRVVAAEQLQHQQHAFVSTRIACAVLLRCNLSCSMATAFVRAGLDQTYLAQYILEK